MKDRKAPEHERVETRIAQRDKTLYCKFQSAKCKVQSAKCQRKMRIGDVDEFYNFSIKTLLFERKSNDLFD